MSSENLLFNIVRTAAFDRAAKRAVQERPRTPGGITESFVACPAVTPGGSGSKRLPGRIPVGVIGNAFAVVPKLPQNAADREGIFDFDEGPHMFCFRGAVEAVFFLIDRDPLVVEKFGKGTIGEIENVSAAHVERVFENSSFRVLQLHDGHLKSKSARPRRG
jgi:hypothetical protein